MPADDPKSSPWHSRRSATVRHEGAGLLAEIAAPPMKLLGPELGRDLASARMLGRVG